MRERSTKVDYMKNMCSSGQNGDYSVRISGDTANGCFCYWMHCKPMDHPSSTPVPCRARRDSEYARRTLDSDLLLLFACYSFSDH
jgi:hypothetical protein